MKLYVKTWPSKRSVEVLEDMCLAEDGAPYEVTGVDGVMQLATQILHRGLNVMVLHHQTEDALWLCVDHRQFQTR